MSGGRIDGSPIKESGDDYKSSQKSRSFAAPQAGRTSILS
jgi:hypothetical protein